MSVFRSSKSALIVGLLIVACATPVAFAGASLDIRPSVCPNLINRDSRVVLPVALVSDVHFVASRLDIDPTSLVLSRADGMGGSATPLDVRPAVILLDVAAPAVSGMCSTQGVDGIRDLRILFGQADVVTQLELDALPLPAVVGLCLSGQTGDGTPFNACDHIFLYKLTFPRRGGPLGTLPFP